MTAATLINDAYLTLAIPQSGEAMSSDEQNDALELLNGMLEEMNDNGLEIYAVTNFQQSLTASQTTPYTIGSGGTFNTARPTKITAANIVQSNGLSTPLEIIGAEEYAKIEAKSAVSIRPRQLFNDNQYPLASLYLHPWAKSSVVIDLWLWQQLADNLTLTTTLAFPPGYYLMLRYNLAVHLLAMFPREMDAGLQAVIDTAKALRAEVTGLRETNVTAQPYAPSSAPQLPAPTPQPTTK